MAPSKQKSQTHLEKFVLPRRTRDTVSEKIYFEQYKKRVPFFRRVVVDEKDRGERYSVMNAGISTFAHFGIGVGIYFLQLLVLCVVFFTSGMIMLAAVDAYKQDKYGVTRDDPLMTISAACDSPISVNATSGCSGGEASCMISYRANCELPVNAAFADLVMSLFFMAAIYLSRFGEKYIEEQLDEAVQTATDYSVEVADPDADADKPDEWFRFFSRFGTVRYITITRKNNELLQYVVAKHRYIRKTAEIEQEIAVLKAEKKQFYSDWGSCCGLIDTSVEKLEKYLIKLHSDLELIDKIVKGLSQKVYDVCRVYVTFETEDCQRNCLRELEVPDIKAMLDTKDNRQAGSTKLFRGSNLLDIVEPTEPDTILWENLEVPRDRRQMFEALSYLVSCGLLVCCYFIVRETTLYSTVLLSVVIGIIDALLPFVFVQLTNMCAPKSETIRQSELQIRLFGARLLLSTIFPYVQAEWNEVLDEQFIQQIINVQIAACFTTTLLELLDVNGLITRHILGPLFAETQAELNLSYSGKDWSLADKYTGIAKILFISLFYTILTPLSLLIATVAFFLVFLVDRFQLLRRWKPAAMLDGKIATRLRQQAILGVAAHMYVTLRFIYSWPMDRAWLQNEATQTFAQVHKRPAYAVWKMTVQDWHTEGQRRVLVPYKTCFYIVALITLYIWIAAPLIKYCKRLFCYQLRTVGDSQGKKFSELPKIAIYVPVVTNREEKFLCCDLQGIQPHHRPCLVRSCEGDKEDLSEYIEETHRPHVLAVVKYYPPEVEQGETADQQPKPAPLMSSPSERIQISNAHSR